MDHARKITNPMGVGPESTSYDRWFRERVRLALADPRPSVPHDEAMARVRATIQAQAAKHKTTSS